LVDPHDLPTGKQGEPIDGALARQRGNTEPTEPIVIFNDLRRNFERNHCGTDGTSVFSLTIAPSRSGSAGSTAVPLLVPMQVVEKYE
jgi:hypothetical protein